jgi:hypothetical protein
MENNTILWVDAEKDPIAEGMRLRNCLWLKSFEALQDWVQEYDKPLAIFIGDNLIRKSYQDLTIKDSKEVFKQRDSLTGLKWVLLFYNSIGLSTPLLFSISDNKKRRRNFNNLLNKKKC